MPSAEVAEYELHVTVADPGEGLTALAVRLGCRCLRIELSRGRTAHQPMLTRRLRATWPAARAAAAALVHDLRRAGCTVRRIKIETGLANPMVPATVAAAAIQPARYFEHHVKLRLAADADLDLLGRLVETHGAHLSRSDRSPGARFVTQRCHGVGSAMAAARLELLLTRLADEGLAVLACDREYVVHDSRPALDAGWLAPLCAPREVLHALV